MSHNSRHYVKKLKKSDSIGTQKIKSFFSKPKPASSTASSSDQIPETKSSCSVEPVESVSMEIPEDVDHTESEIVSEEMPEVITMSGVDELIQNVVDTIDTASTQRLNLTELLKSIDEAKKQVTYSADESKKKVKCHFESVQQMLSKILSSRMEELLAEIGEIERKNLEPLTECEEMINLAMADAAQCMEQGRSVLANSPEDNMENLLKFKDSTDTKNLNILPEVPSLHEVASIDVEFLEDLYETVQAIVLEDGCVYERAPVQISELHEVPGGMLVKWEEIDDNVEAGEFQLQYCGGHVEPWDLSKCAFQTVYTGPDMLYLVPKLRTNMPYSFRVSCRQDGNSLWSGWSVPRTAYTKLLHYQWQDGTPGYMTGLEDKVGTRTTGLTRVLYSKTACYRSGYRLTFRFLDTGEKSPLDGIGISVNSDDIETMKREGSAFLGTDGAVYVDGQEMKTKLPSLSRNSIVTIETETLPNGKVRVSVQVEEKELTFDWKIDRPVTLGLIGGTGTAAYDNAGQHFYFGMIFSHEDWKVCVE